MRRRQRLSCRRLARRRLHRVRQRHPAPALRVAVLDHLLDPPPPATLGSILVTNPPFSKLDGFVARSFALFEAGHLAAAVLLFRNDSAAPRGGSIISTAPSPSSGAAAGRTGYREPRAIRAFWPVWGVWLPDRIGPPIHHRVKLGDFGAPRCGRRAKLQPPTRLQ
jgi:hypothetical protein